MSHIDSSAMRTICEGLTIDPITVNCLLDQAADDARETWDPAKGLSEEAFVRLAVKREFANLHRQARRAKRRHKATSLDDMLDPPPVFDSDPEHDPVVVAEVSELRSALPNIHVCTFDLMKVGCTQPEIAERLGLPLRSIERIVQDIKSLVDTFV